MPIFYNQATPTPSTKNTINSVTVNYGIRDFLLNLNLAPQYPQISTSINGSPQIGQPVLDTMIGTGSNVIPIGLPLTVNGLLFKDLNVILNTFQNDPSVANNIESINYIPDISNTDYINSEWPLGSNTSYPTGANPLIDQYGILAKTTEADYKKDNVIRNLYLDEDLQIDAASFINYQPLQISQQLPSYLEVFGGLNQGGVAGSQAINILGSFISGQGIGIGTNGSVVPNFDIRSSLAGRVLGSTGLMNDTKLGVVGAQQLALALANNAAFNVQQQLIGALNVEENLISLIQNGNLATFPRPSYKITIPETTGGRILDTTGQILGFTIPRSYLDDKGSIFQTESGVVDNIDRANSMIDNTGKGQVAALISNIRASQHGISHEGVDSPENSKFRTGYAPAYKNNKGVTQITDGILYAFSKEGKVINLFGSDDGIIANISYNREQMVSDAGFSSPDELGVGIGGTYIPKGYNGRGVKDVSFSWTSDNAEAVNKFANASAFFPGFVPVDTQIHNDKKSLLAKTQILFNSKGMKNLVSVKGEMGVNSSQIQTANNNGISKGSAVLSSSRYDLDNGVVNSSGAEAIDNFCRSWTTTDRYDSVSNLIRNKGLYDKNKAPYRFQTNNSVLEEGGFVKISPYMDDVPTDPKKFMFSIENLAWAGDPWTNLPQCEQGPGDLITGKKGRIMWFPPYDIQFSENNNVDWESTKFVGRGEPVYTYNNTERTGTLSFKIVVDHPSYYNAFKAKSGQIGPDDNYIASYFAGCVDPTEGMIRRLINVSTASEIITNEVPVNQPKVDLPKPPTATLKVYFPNDNASLDNALDYENGLSASTSSGLAFAIDYTTNCDGLGYGLGTFPSNFTPGVTTTWPDRYNFGLNYKNYKGEQYDINGQKFFGYLDPNYTTAMINYLKNECKYCVVRAKGYASPQGNLTYNLRLAKARGEYIINELKTKWGSSLGLKPEELNKRFIPHPTGQALTQTGCPVQTAQNPNPPTDILECKIDRYVEITVEYSSELAAEAEKALQPVPTVKKEVRTITREVTNKFYTECNYFERMVEDNPFVFDEIRQKIRYFHPAFHSTTPEGLNSRLTFLLQCTRQGPTLESQGATNLAFGRPPVCILRIGDFYNTKIVMDTVNIDYEPLVWDLNPEGIGVQPMIANVDISFKFLGGSSLYGPLNKLQNALSFNYFANTHVYDPRADYISKIKSVATPEPLEQSSGDKSITDKLRDESLKNIGNYRIVDGVLKYDPEEGKIISDITTIQNSEVDQVVAEEVVNSGVENTVQPDYSATTFTDSEIISCIKLQNYQQVNDNDISIALGLGFQIPNDKPNIKLKLANTTKTYRGTLTLGRLTSNRVDTISNITLKYNTNDSVKFIASNEVIISINELSWVVNADLSSTALQTLLDAKNDVTGEIYSLKISWDTGSYSTIGYLPTTN